MIAIEKMAHWLQSRTMWVGVFLVCMAGTCWADVPYQPVHPDAGAEPWRWRSFPELRGLGLRCLAEGSDGAIWFGLKGGVRRYDGIHWTAYEGEDGPGGVATLCTTRDGSLYAGTRKGISRFRDGAWEQVFPPEGHLFWPIRDLLEARDGSLWGATAWGVLHRKGKAWTLYTSSDTGASLRELVPYVKLVIVPDKAVPVRTWMEGGGCVRNRMVTAIAPGGPAERAGLIVGDRIVNTEMLRNSEDGSADREIAATVVRGFRPDTLRVTIDWEQVDGTFREFSIADVFQDRDGRMWFGLQARWEGYQNFTGGKILCYDPSLADAAAWRLYTEKDGLFNSSCVV